MHGKVERVSGVTTGYPIREQAQIQGEKPPAAPLLPVESSTLSLPSSTPPIDTPPPVTDPKPKPAPAFQSPTALVELEDGVPSDAKTPAASFTGMAHMANLMLQNQEWFTRESQIPVRTIFVPAEDGGPAWKETTNSFGFTTRSREIAAEDGKGPWTESCDFANRPTHRTRSYEEDGQRWTENIHGRNQWRVRHGIEDEARAEAATTLSIRPGVTFTVHGKATAEQMKVLQQALSDAPPEAIGQARVIYLSDYLGDGDNKPNTILGLGGDGVIKLRRNVLDDVGSAKATLYHEMGHNHDVGGRYSCKAPWGTGRSATLYGETNEMEDYAEIHAVVLRDWQRLCSLDPAGWENETLGEKKADILKSYGVNVPSFKPLVQPSLSEELATSIMQQHREHRADMWKAWEEILRT